MKTLARWWVCGELIASHECIILKKCPQHDPYARMVVVAGAVRDYVCCEAHSYNVQHQCTSMCFHGTLCVAWRKLAVRDLEPITLIGCWTSNTNTMASGVDPGFSYGGANSNVWLHGHGKREGVRGSVEAFATVQSNKLC